MESIRIKLSALWISRMLVGFLGDVLRYLEPGMLEQLSTGEVDGMRMTQGLFFVSAIMMVLPIAMVFLSLTLKYRVNRLINIILAIFIFCLDAVGIFTYAYAYAVFLIAVGLVFNILTVYYAWTWR